MNDEFISLPSINEIEEGYLKDLRRIRLKIHAEHGANLKVSCHCSVGFAIDEIDRFAVEKGADLIVMGMRGGGFLTEKIIGSVTTALLRKASCPVLAISNDVRFRSVKRIVFASDFEETTPEVLQPLRNFVNLFKARLYVLNVISEPEFIPEVTEAVQAMQIDRNLADLDHSFHDIHDDDVIEGINAFITKNKMDMVVMIPRKHSVFTTIFRESRTKKLAFRAAVPLLALHENKHTKSS